MKKALRIAKIAGLLTVTSGNILCAVNGLSEACKSGSNKKKLLYTICYFGGTCSTSFILGSMVGDQLVKLADDDFEETTKEDLRNLESEEES